jgi:hypothetical protein
MHPIVTANLYTAWIALLLGSLAGVSTGLFFHRPDWLGGYGAWPRRMVRLGHVAFLGLGFLNLALVGTVRLRGMEQGIALPSILLIVGTITMPLVCYLSAVRTAFRHLFALPALSVTIAIASFLWRMAAS